MGRWVKIYEIEKKKKDEKVDTSYDGDYVYQGHINNNENRNFIIIIGFLAKEKDRYISRKFSNIKKQCSKRCLYYTKCEKIRKSD